MRPLIRYLSVCSGIEAATVAWHHMGWEPVGFSEIEPFPSAVLKHHYPNTPNLGDMTKYKEWGIGAIDLLVGGTPCQSFSVAGLRKGLEDPRGNLALVYCGILDHFRPRWFVWENVPGVLSSAGGRDFGSFLGALAQLGYGFAYRVLDAQWFGVAQRRRRVFVVGYLGDWRPAAAVLFERQSLRRDTAPSREKGQATTGTLTTRFGPSNDGGLGTDEAMNGALQPIVGALTAKGPEAMGAPEVDAHHYIPMAQPMCFQQNTRDEVRYINGDGQIAGALAAEARMKQQNYVAQPIAFHATQEPINGLISPALGSNMYAGVAVDVYNQTIDGQVSATLTEACGGTNTSGPKVMQAVAQSIGITLHETDGTATVASYTELSSSLRARIPSGVENSTTTAVQHNMAVRRLTPIECERLQGFPDNYTAIPWRGKEETPDGPRYKALGNSMAVPVMKWIGENIREVDNA